MMSCQYKEWAAAVDDRKTSGGIPSDTTDPSWTSSPGWTSDALPLFAASFCTLRLRDPMLAHILQWMHTERTLIGVTHNRTYADPV
jgi:hypothetical protein